MTEIIDGLEYLTAAEAAAELSTTETRILMLLKQKALNGMLVEQGWFISKDSVTCFDRHAEDAGQQLQCRTSCNSSKCGCH